jgi:8-oxo-dGTP diphosphatase
MDVESPHTPFLLAQHKRSSSAASLDELSNSSDKAAVRFIKKRELFAWSIITLQTCALAFALTGRFSPITLSNVATLSERRKSDSVLSINNKAPSYHENKFLQATSLENPSNAPFFDPPTVYPAAAGLVSRVWHSNGTPEINEGLQTGSCWCSGDDYCMCTPALAIDMILTSGPDHVWLVRRKDKGLMALMGGFNEVGETVEEACRRELKEEMNLDLPGQELTLFGVYSDPKRDSRKHAVSVVFHMDIPPHISPAAGDDACDVVRMPLSTVESLDMFIDHKTVLRDFLKLRERQRLTKLGTGGSAQPIPRTGDGEPFKRSLCELSIS